MNIEKLVKLRPTKEKDFSYLVLMAQGQEVGIPPNYLEGGISAVNADDIPVGYIHIQKTPLGAHVAPVVVFDNWRGHGVGSLLIKRALKIHGELKLVSNGSSNGFYEKLGFEPIGWDEIEPEFQRDCLDCEFYKQCNPKPYLLRRS